MDQSFALLPQGGEPSDDAVGQVCEAVTGFVRALSDEARLAEPPAPQPAAEPMQVDDASGVNLLNTADQLCATAPSRSS